MRVHTQTPKVCEKTVQAGPSAPKTPVYLVPLPAPFCRDGLFLHRQHRKILERGHCISLWGRQAVGGSSRFVDFRAVMPGSRQE